MWNLEKGQRSTYWQSRNRVTEGESERMVTGRGRGAGMSRKAGVDPHAINIMSLTTRFLWVFL